MHSSGGDWSARRTLDPPHMNQVVTVSSKPWRMHGSSVPSWSAAAVGVLGVLAHHLQTHTVAPLQPSQRGLGTHCAAIGRLLQRWKRRQRAAGDREGGGEEAGGSLLLSPPHDDHAGGVGRRQQALVAVEADVQHGAAVTLQLVDDGLGVALHVEEVDAGVLAAGHCGRSARRSIRGPEETPRLCTAWRANPKFLP